MFFYRPTQQQLDVAWVLQCYGWLIPRNSAIAPADFAERIRQSFTMFEPHNARAVAIVEQLRGVFIHDGPTVSFTPEGSNVA